MGHHWSDEHGVPELGNHGDGGVGRPGAEPQHHVRDGHLEYSGTEFHEVLPLSPGLGKDFRLNSKTKIKKIVLKLSIP